MQKEHLVGGRLHWQELEAGQYSYVYYYLLAGIMLMVAVFLFI